MKQYQFIVYSIKTLSRQQETIEYSYFANDYNKVLGAFNKKIVLDEKENEILEIFEYKL